MAAYERTSSSDFHEVFEDNQFSLFFMALLMGVLTGYNMLMAFDKTGDMRIAYGDEVIEEIRTNNERALSELLNESFVVVNIKKILSIVFDKEGMTRNKDFVISFLKPAERKIIEVMRKKKLKQVIIQYGPNSEPTHIRVTGRVTLDEAISKLARYMKKGNYQHIEFITRDGDLVSYDETDVVKL